MKALKIATFNINGIRARLPNLLQWLERDQPDIVCLQELKAPESLFPYAEFEAAGYGAICLGQASWNGVAILARDAQPLQSRCGLPGDTANAKPLYRSCLRVFGAACITNGNRSPGRSWTTAGVVASADRMQRTCKPVNIRVCSQGISMWCPGPGIYNRYRLKDALLQPQT